ncbi:MAG: DUF2062 domain-containing protein [Candidatus Marinimicrobia bacterium]|nr:DUF2062 domain-containing protein [Candidatus Neomarinimicrobiota bacterium]MCF7828814.1 DUF2062 domain-containing protein [Candidatus Neomarinimicrobiota bacterium]MCF7880731.1 DUF2062 domain-containing protein [Candidatus Neomarinimicrobiota bacterium]
MRIFSPVRTVKKYLKTLVTIHSSPRAIALGASLGIYVGFTPFVGFQTLLGITLATIFGCNRLAAAIGVNLHTPILWLWPGVFALEYRIGQWMLGGHSFPPFDMASLGWTSIFEVGLPILLGSAVIGIPAAIISYPILRKGVIKYHKRHSHYNPVAAPKENLSDIKSVPSDHP